MATRDYAQFLPWVAGWPQHSRGRIAMQSFLAEVAEQKAFLITPSLIDNVLSQPLADLGKADAASHAAALAALFYLRHLQGDGRGEGLKAALAATGAQQQAWRSYLAQLARFNEVWEAVKADPRSQKLADGSYTVPSGYEVPHEPKRPLTEVEQQATVDALNHALLALLGDQPGETVVAGLRRAGFVKGLAGDSGDVAAAGMGSAALSASDVAIDLTPDYGKAKAVRAHLLLSQRSWPVEVIVSTSAMNPALVSSTKSRAVYRMGRFQFETGPGLTLPLIKEIARDFTIVEELVERMPWDLPPMPPKGEWFIAKLYESMEDYNKIAPPSSGGFYSLKEKVFHVPYKSLGITQDSGAGHLWVKSKAFDSDTLIHELTHMMMDRIIPYVPLWLTEGAAEYVDTIPFANNVMRPGDVPLAIQGYTSSMISYSAKIHANYSFGASSKRMVEVLHMSSKAWHADAGTTQAVRYEPMGPPLASTSMEIRPAVPMVVSTPMRPADISAHQHDLYMHACLLFYYFMHLDSAQRGDPMLTFIDRVSDSVPQWQLFEKAIAQYQEHFRTYQSAWAAFANLPGVTKLPDGRIQYPGTLKPPAAPVFPRAPVDLSKLPDQDAGLAYLDSLVKGRSDAQLAEAFRVGFAKIGLTLK